MTLRKAYLRKLDPGRRKSEASWPPALHAVSIYLLLLSKQPQNTELRSHGAARGFPGAGSLMLQRAARISELLAGGSPVALTWLLAALVQGSHWLKTAVLTGRGFLHCAVSSMVAGQGERGWWGRKCTQEHNRTATCPDLTSQGTPCHFYWSTPAHSTQTPVGESQQGHFRGCLWK